MQTLPRTVLFLHSSAGGYGADRQLLALAGGLDPNRYNPVVALPERGSLAAQLDDAGVECRIVPLAVLRRVLLTPTGTAGTLARIAGDRRALPALIRDHGAQIVHSNTSVVLSGQAAAKAAGARHVVHVREIYAGAGAHLRPLLRRRLQRADALACVSRAVADQFAEAPNVEVIHDGLLRTPAPPEPAEARRVLGLDPRRFTVALLGRVSAWKGQEVLARALAEPALAGIGAVGLVAGEPYPGNEGALRSLEALRDQLGIGHRLRLLGFRDDPDTVLGAVDAVAVPSTLPDPFPNSALEAAAAGLPVVAAAHGGVVEMLRDGETGRLVAPGDPRALAGALRELADDPAARERLGTAAAADVRARFSRERMLAAVQHLYDRLV